MVVILKSKKNVSIAVLEWLIKKENITGLKLDECMAVAAENGNTDVVRLMIYHGADDFNRTMGGAAEGGHIDIVRLTIETIDQKEAAK